MHRNGSNVLRNDGHELSQSMSDDELGRVVDDTCVRINLNACMRDVGCDAFGRMHSTNCTFIPGQHHSEQDCGRPHSLEDNKKCAMRLICHKFSILNFTVIYFLVWFHRI